MHLIMVSASHPSASLCFRGHRHFGVHRSRLSHSPSRVLPQNYSLPRWTLRAVVRVAGEVSVLRHRPSDNGHAHALVRSCLGVLSVCPPPAENKNISGGAPGCATCIEVCAVFASFLNAQTNEIKHRCANNQLQTHSEDRLVVPCQRGRIGPSPSLERPRFSCFVSCLRT